MTQPANYTPPKPIQLGRFRALVAEPYRRSELLDILENIDQQLADAKRISHGEDVVYELPLTIEGQAQSLAVKRFKPQSALKDWADTRIGSKAERSYRAADYLMAAGVGTPAPVAALDCWEGKRLRESYYLCLFERADSFREHLSHILWEVRDNEPLMALLETLAPAIRAMHDAGFMHGDMGNQNILMPRTQDGALGKPQFIDLNRCRIRTALTNRERAFDLSRLALPGEYLKFFMFMYCQDQDVPPELALWQARYRRRFARHQRTRRWRHPVRTLKQWLAGQRPKPSGFYPEPRDLWVWDEKSAQAMIVLSRAEKNRVRSKSHTLNMLKQTLMAAPAVYRRYKRLQDQSFGQSVSMAGRVGVALHPHTEYVEPELELLEALGRPPVLLRFCHHETPALWEQTVNLIHRLHEKGVPVMVAFVQDRQALLTPDRWRNLLETVIPRIADQVDDIEVGHAINRVKWGLWQAHDYVQLLQPALDLQRRYPSIRLTGPACIDFEYAYVVAALKALPESVHLSALSHHLYVDRRGHPENPQGRFSTLEKCELLRAIAQWSPRVEDRVVISEVNWPVKGTNVWSPVGAGYESPRGRRQPPGETEADYADYMLRYYALALCSGHVDKVYWWRLSAHGYGLVDDRDNWRRRPAFHALAFFLRTLGESEFVQKYTTDDEVYQLEFAQGETQILLAWRSDGRYGDWPDFPCDQVFDVTGQETDRRSLSGSPVYLVRKPAHG